MLIITLVAILKGGLFKGHYSKMSELYEEDEATGKIFPKDNADDDELVEYGIYSLFIYLFSLIYNTLMFVFLINAIKNVDIYLIPSALWLTYYIGGLVLMLSKKKKKSIKELKVDSVKNKIIRFLFLIYLIYILVLQFT